MSDTVKHCWPSAWLEAASKAGMALPGATGGWNFKAEITRDMLEAFATAIQEAATLAEREACARVCEAKAQEYANMHTVGGDIAMASAVTCAEDIRAR